MMKSILSISSIASLLFIAASTSSAEAREGAGFVELVGGPLLVQGDDDYDDLVDDSFKLGIRAGGMSGKVGFEIAADWTPPDVENPFSGLGVDIDANRYRFLVGGRGGTSVGKAFIFGRAAIGIDYVTATVSAPIVGEREESDTGFALEVGLGAIVRLGSFYLGGQLGVPMSFHSEDDDEDSQNDLNLDYTSVEIEILATAGILF